MMMRIIHTPLNGSNSVETCTLINMNVISICIRISLLISVILAQRVTIPSTAQSFRSASTPGWNYQDDAGVDAYGGLCPSGSTCLHVGNNKADAIAYLST
eukprot:1108393_1